VPGATATPPTPTALTCGDSFEPDSFGSPPDITSGSPHTRVLCDATDVDRATFTAPASASYRVKVLDIADAAGLVIEVVSADGASVLATVTNDSVLDVQLGAGPVILRVRRDPSSPSTEPLAYRLQISQLQPFSSIYLPVVVR
jgi:hypothetical protein